MCNLLLHSRLHRFNFALTKPGKWFRGTIFKNCKMMKKTNRKGELINERVNIDSQTVYHANGNVNIYPCMYEQEKTPFVANGTQTSHRGRMTVHDNGIGQFKAYAEGGAPRYRTLYSTESGELYASQKSLFVRVKLPLDMSACRQAESLFKQIADICDYIKKSL